MAKNYDGEEDLFAPKRKKPMPDDIPEETKEDPNADEGSLENSPLPKTKGQQSKGDEHVTNSDDKAFLKQVMQRKKKQSQLMGRSKTKSNLTALNAPSTDQLAQQ